MNGNYLLDTNIVIAFLAGDTAVIDSMRASKALYISSQKPDCRCLVDPGDLMINRISPA